MAKAKPADSTPSPEAPADNIALLQLKLDDPVPESEPAVEATATPEPEVTPSAPSSPQIGADAPSLVGAASLMRQWGYEVDDDATDEDVQKHLESLEERAAKAEAAEKELNDLRAWRSKLEAERNQPTPEPTAKAPAPAEAVTDDDLGIPDRPEIDEVTRQVLLFAHQAGKVTELAGGVLSTDDGNLRGYVDSYNKQLAAARAYDAQWTPRKVAELIAQKQIAAAREAIRKEVAEELQGTFRQRDLAGFVDEHKATHAHWLFNQQQDAFTPEGQIFAAEFDAQIAQGTPPEMAVKRAQAMVQLETGKTPWVKEQPKPQEQPAERVVKFRNRLKNNGHDTLPTSPVSRPAAGAAARPTKGLTLDQNLSASFHALMSEKVADRM